MDQEKSVSTENVERELTFGEKAAGITFNPSNNPEVDVIKGLYAQIIDQLNVARSQSTGEKARYYSKAISQAEDSQMNAVKAATWRY